VKTAYGQALTFEWVASCLTAGSEGMDCLTSDGHLADPARWLCDRQNSRHKNLKRLFGLRVDLVAKDGLHRVIRDQVLADAQVLYAA
jgi:hypothetical protein